MKIAAVWTKWALPLVSGAVVAGLVAAQTYPTKAVTLVSPFAAGGTSDVIARATARLLEAELALPPSSMGPPMVINW